MRKQKRFCAFCGARLERISHDGRQRQYCGRCDIVHYDNPIPATAALVLSDTKELMLVKRAMDPGKGEWGLPGGFMEIDELPEECILRELREETGIIGEVERLLAVVHEDSPFYGPLVIVGYRVISKEGALVAGDDATEVRYFPLDGLPRVAFAAHCKLIDAMQKLKP